LIHPTETHVFRDSEELFKAKHDTFMDMYLGDCLLGGDALNHTNLDEVAMIHKDDQDSVFCSRILNGIINSQSLIKVLSKSIIKFFITIKIKIYFFFISIKKIIAIEDIILSEIFLLPFTKSNNIRLKIDKFNKFGILESNLREILFAKII